MAGRGPASLRTVRAILCSSPSTVGAFYPAGDKIAPDGSVTAPTACVDPNLVKDDHAVTKLQSCYEDLTLQTPRYENLAFGSEAPPLPP